MSVNERNIPRESQIVANTILQSQQATQKDKRLIPEDMRTHRFCYQSGLPHMLMAPRLSGLQLGDMPPGKLVLFESTPMAKQNKSVDAEDTDGPAVMGELLAGEAVLNLRTQYSEVGFDEILTLRGLEIPVVDDLFFEAHPPLEMAISEGWIDPCIYANQDQNDSGFRDVCVTCRQALINKLLKSEPTPAVREVLEALKVIVDTGRATMRAKWNSWTGEVRSGPPSQGQPPKLKAITPDMEWFMRQLHERTSEDLELAKVSAGARSSADIVKHLLDKVATPAAAPVIDVAAIKAQIHAEMRAEDEARAAIAAEDEASKPETVEPKKPGAKGK